MIKNSRVNLKNILLVFMMLQPFLDSYILYSDRIIGIFGFSPTTIFRYTLIGILFLIVFIKNINNKASKYMIIYGFFAFVYVIIHHFVCISLNEKVIYESFKYNLMMELMYLLRLIYPFILTYIVYMIKPSKKEFKFTIQCTTIILCSILLLLNIFVIARTSYFNDYITGNIFDWFNNNIVRYRLASKGWFNSANQIGGLVLLLIPLNFYYALENNKTKDVIIFLLLLLSSFSIGTRVTGVGTLVVLFALLIICYISKYMLRKKVLKSKVYTSLLILLFALLFFSHAPIVNLSGNNILSLLHLNEVVDDKQGKDIQKPQYNDEDTCEFLKLTSVSFEYYTDLYPCEKNKAFWDNFVQSKEYEYANNRLLERLITNEVYDKIKNKNVKLFGMSRSRFENAKIYLERDIIVHYFTLGIIGIILFIIPYFAVCGYICIKKVIKRTLSDFDIYLIIAILLPIVTSILTGHIIDELIVTLYIGFVLGFFMLQNQEDTIQEKRNLPEDNRKKILFVVDENKMGGVSILLEDMMTIPELKKYKIDILVLHNSGSRLKKIDSSINILYGTKFFEAIDYNLKDLIINLNIILFIKKIYLIFLMKTGLIKYKIKSEREKILDTKYDVEIAFKDGFTAVFTAYGDSIKKIHWLHYEYKKYNANGNYPKLFNKILPTFDKIVAVSDNVKNDFNEIYHLEEKTITIANYVSINRILEMSKEKCDRKLDKDKINIVCVGRLHPCKGYDRLINCINDLSDNEKSKISIEIYGGGLEKQNLQEMINKYDLQNTINLKGQVNNPYKYIKENDLFILCSRFETFGLVIVESMLLGVPVLALKNSNTDNLIKNKFNGYVIENSDAALLKAIKKIISNPSIIKKCKKNLINYKYDDNDKIIKQILKLLK